MANVKRLVRSILTNVNQNIEFAADLRYFLQN